LATAEIPALLENGRLAKVAEELKKNRLCARHAGFAGLPAWQHEQRIKIKS
jgi:hypothetical protein